MEQQRKEATERLLSRQGHHNLVYNEENDGVDVEDEGLVAVSNFTSILGLSTLTAACITFGFGCAVRAFSLNCSFNSCKIDGTY